MIKVQLTGSRIGSTKRQLATLDGLGLTRRGKTVVLKRTASVDGMVRKVSHLVHSETVEG